MVHNNFKTEIIKEQTRKFASWTCSSTLAIMDFSYSLQTRVLISQIYYSKYQHSRFRLFISFKIHKSKSLFNKKFFKIVFFFAVEMFQLKLWDGKSWKLTDVGKPNGSICVVMTLAPNAEYTKSRGKTKKLNYIIYIYSVIIHVS